MLLDPFTVLVQIGNFLVLLVLLRLLLYKPVLGLLEQRQQRLDAAHAAAEQAREQAAGLAVANAELDRDLMGRRTRVERELTAELTAESERRRERLQAELSAERDRLARELRRQRDEVLGELRCRLGRELLDSAGDLLVDLADADLHRAIARSFTRALAEAGPVAAAEERELRLGGDCPQALREQVVAELTRQGLAPTRVVDDPELLLGFELRIGSRSLRWDLASRLESCERRFDEAVRRIQVPGAAA